MGDFLSYQARRGPWCECRLRDRPTAGDPAGRFRCGDPARSVPCRCAWRAGPGPGDKHGAAPSASVALKPNVACLRRHDDCYGSAATPLGPVDLVTVAYARDDAIGRAFVQRESGKFRAPGPGGGPAAGPRRGASSYMHMVVPAEGPGPGAGGHPLTRERPASPAPGPGPGAPGTWASSFLALPTSLSQYLRGDLSRSGSQSTELPGAGEGPDAGPAEPDPGPTPDRWPDDWNWADPGEWEHSSGPEGGGVVEVLHALAGPGSPRDPASFAAFAMGLLREHPFARGPEPGPGSTASSLGPSPSPSAGRLPRGGLAGGNGDGGGGGGDRSRPGLGALLDRVWSGAGAGRGPRAGLGGGGGGGGGGRDPADRRPMPAPAEDPDPEPRPPETAEEARVRRELQLGMGPAGGPGLLGPGAPGPRCDSRCCGAGLQLADVPGQRPDSPADCNLPAWAGHAAPVLARLYTFDLLRRRDICVEVCFVGRPRGSLARGVGLRCFTVDPQDPSVFHPVDPQDAECWRRVALSKDLREGALRGVLRDAAAVSPAWFSLVRWLEGPGPGAGPTPAPLEAARLLGRAGTAPPPLAAAALEAPTGSGLDLDPGPGSTAAGAAAAAADADADADADAPPAPADVAAPVSRAAVIWAAVLAAGDPVSPPDPPAGRRTPPIEAHLAAALRTLANPQAGWARPAPLLSPPDPDEQEAYHTLLLLAEAAHRLSR
ncbi:hypothetical protein H696_02678 [Fonticula alba]|uniref:Uncharacterized protein n=1 Tax=Fonticula alba TaxID=691883 RepID=A0A058Z8A0_FONAL|nr:hypothetical protein H696_02678 [Fonticula alba]KCV70351.1 hypothetical protein H696_02678 [Fonticula alba]|eukprot:XP_009494867.1 hypothetical protein H696_02678 [Fonticula alba]